MSKISITEKNYEDVAKAFTITYQHNEKLLHVYKGKVDANNTVAMQLIEDLQRQNELYKGIIDKINTFASKYNVSFKV